MEDTKTSTQQDSLLQRLKDFDPFSQEGELTSRLPVKKDDTDPVPSTFIRTETATTIVLPPFEAVATTAALEVCSHLVEGDTRSRKQFQLNPRPSYRRRSIQTLVDDQTESGDESDLDMFLSKIDFSTSPTAVPLIPFVNQVGGHAAFLRLTKNAVCKPMALREKEFYERMPDHHPELLPFTPTYLGLVNVRYPSPNRLHTGGESSLLNGPAREGALFTPEVILERNPKQLVSSWMSSTSGVDKRLRRQILKEVLSPENLRSRQRQLEASAKQLRDSRRASAHLQRAHGHRRSRSQSDSPTKHRGDIADEQVVFLMDEDEASGNDLAMNKKTKDYPPSTTSLLENDDDENKRTVVSASPIAIQARDAPLEANGAHISSSLEENTPYINPWSLHVYAEQLQKFTSKSQEISAKNANDETTSQDSDLHRFLLLEDLTFGLKYPNILDLKMGTRQHAIGVSDEKRRGQTKKVQESTSATLGVRLCGMQVYLSSENQFFFQDKYYGRRLSTRSEFCSALATFLYDGNLVRREVIPLLIKRLKTLRDIVRRLNGYRLFSSSLLLLYDGDQTSWDPKNNDELSDNGVQVRMVDFAHCILYSQHEEIIGNFMHKFGIDDKEEAWRRFKEIEDDDLQGPDSGYLLALDNLIECFHIINTSHVPIQMQNNVKRSNQQSVVDPVCSASHESPESQTRSPRLVSAAAREELPTEYRLARARERFEGTNS